MILDRIITVKREEVDRLKKSSSREEMADKIAAASPPRDFSAAVRRQNGPVKLIAEVKQASPSRGIIREDFDPPAIASAYAEAGAAAISVLTDKQFFHGRSSYLQQVKKTVSIPVLRKDFIIDPLQIYQSRLMGADAILLIAAVLEPGRLEECLGVARELGLAALVEVHDEDELLRVLKTDAGIIGINNRNLKNFEVELETTYRLLPLVSPDRVVISESGIQNHADVTRLGQAGVDAILVGEALMRSRDIAAGVRKLLGVDNDG